MLNQQKGQPIMAFNDNNPLAPRDAKFINVLYDTPVGVLLQMDKVHLRHCLTRAKLVCRWLEGILKLMTKLETEGK
jgi:hypothetical protein